MTLSLAWIATAIFIVAALIISVWLWWEWRMDRIAQEGRDLWLDMTRPYDESGKRWPGKKDI